jgi:hypothetical protein
MTELEQALRELAVHVDWPDTPELALRLEPRRRPRSWLRPAALAIALAVLALAVAFAVAPARSAILRFLHIGGVTIERVDTLPPAQERPLAADLGRRVTAARAVRVLGEKFALPRTRGNPQLYEKDFVVSALLATPQPVLLSEFRANGIVLKKLSLTQGVQLLSVSQGARGAWIAGGHVYVGPAALPRLAANVLVWERGSVTYRLEGRSLTQKVALRLAHEIDEGP